MGISEYLSLIREEQHWLDASELCGKEFLNACPYIHTITERYYAVHLYFTFFSVFLYPADSYQCWRHDCLYFSIYFFTHKSIFWIPMMYISAMYQLWFCAHMVTTFTEISTDSHFRNRGWSHYWTSLTFRWERIYFLSWQIIRNDFQYLTWSILIS